MSFSVIIRCYRRQVRDKEVKFSMNLPRDKPSFGTALGWGCRRGHGILINLWMNIKSVVYCNILFNVYETNLELNDHCLNKTIAKDTYYRFGDENTIEGKYPLHHWMKTDPYIITLIYVFSSNVCQWGIANGAIALAVICVKLCYDVFCSVVSSGMPEKLPKVH